MKRFLEAHCLAFTPLTPIHIGCGEDFEPTNYVIDGGVLYHFDPARIPLTEKDRADLQRAVAGRGDEVIRAVQNFFYKKRAQCKAVASLQVPVAVGVAEWYESRVGQVAQRETGGRKVSNQLEIERTAHHPYTGVPYLPGSSLKGSIRTAWLNHLDRGGVVQRRPEEQPKERGSEVEAELLGGSFAQDPFRQVKLADACGSGVLSRVVFSVDRDKEQRLSRTGEGIEKNLFVRREVIAPAQYRALAGEIRFDLLPERDDPQRTPSTEKRIRGLADLAQACNRFYLPRLQADLDLIRRRFADDPWVDGVKCLIEALKQEFDDGRAMLLRVGRHSGAESVTLDKRRWIQIRGGKRRPTYWAREATTIWLAAERQDSRAELLPFGWLLAEVTSQPRTNDVLRNWCDRNAVQRKPDPIGVTATEHEREKPQQQAVTWEKARLRFNGKNGTLTAIGPSNAEAHALAPRGAELLAKLPPDVQRKVRENQFVRVVASVQSGELIDVAPSP